MEVQQSLWPYLSCWWLSLSHASSAAGHRTDTQIFRWMTEEKREEREKRGKECLMGLLASWFKQILVSSLPPSNMTSPLEKLPKYQKTWHCLIDSHSLRTGKVLCLCFPATLLYPVCPTFSHWSPCGTMKSQAIKAKHRKQARIRGQLVILFMIIPLLSGTLLNWAHTILQGDY